MGTNTLIIDPPSGWRYGFPKPYSKEENETLEEWLVKNGYPQKEIDSYGKHFYCRFWEQEIKDGEE